MSDIKPSVSPVLRAWQAVFQSPRAFTGKIQILGLLMLGVIITLAVLAPLFTLYGPKELACEPFETPSRAHWLGCNDVGQDLWSQLLYGARVSLFVGIAVAAVSTLIATVLALTAGFMAGGALSGGGAGAGSWIDRLIMRTVDVVLSLPFLPLVIVLGVYFGASVQTQILVITLVLWAQPVRELRAQVLSIRAAGFVEASRSMGAGGRFIGLRHILPELAPLIVPQFVRIAHAAILVEASLSFLGLGDPLQNSWGSTLFHANARAAFLTGSWTYWILPPGLAIAYSVLAFAFVGYGFDASLTSPAKSAKRRAPKRSSGTVPSTTDGTAPFLSIRNLTIDYPSGDDAVHAVRGLDLDIQKGTLVGLVGESGCGKTTVAMAILQLLRQPAQIVAGSIRLERTHLLSQTPKELRHIRRSTLGLIPQSAMNALNPVLTIGGHLEEVLGLNPEHSRHERRTLAVDWITKVGLEERHLAAYPHELSGGMRQRAVIAIALCSTPKLVIADEPTTGLDVLVQDEIMQLLLHLKRELGLTILFITHNLPLILRHCDRIAVMRNGVIVEEGRPDGIRAKPEHEHTRALFDNLPAIGSRKDRCPDRRGTADQPLLELRAVSKSFRSAAGVRFLSRRGKSVVAVKNISFALKPGETLGLVGESGAGKSTIARLITGMIAPDSGDILFRGRPLQGLSKQARKDRQRAVHMVFQDPYQSLNNRMSVADLIAEPLVIHGRESRSSLRPQIRTALEAVRLPADDAFLLRRPVTLSGGQRQRVALARAIIIRPELIIADEPTSMLDQSIRMGVMEVMEDLRRNFGIAFLLITHDVALAQYFCDRLMVLRHGQLVEAGTTEQLIQFPKKPYTRALIAAA